LAAAAAAVALAALAADCFFEAAPDGAEGAAAAFGAGAAAEVAFDLGGMFSIPAKLKVNG